MVRLVSAPSVLAVLGLAGLAMAQDGLIVDPWKRAVAVVVGKKPAPAPLAVGSTPVERAAPRPIGVASFPIEEPASKPKVVPVGPPLSLDANPWVAPVGPVTHDEVLDPWATPSANAGAASHLVAARSGHRNWAFEINEIVDPWSKGPLAAVTDPMIVDPWAR